METSAKRLKVFLGLDKDPEAALGSSSGSIPGNATSVAKPKANIGRAMTTTSRTKTNTNEACAGGANSKACTMVSKQVIKEDKSGLSCAEQAEQGDITLEDCQRKARIYAHLRHYFKDEIAYYKQLRAQTKAGSTVKHFCAAATSARSAASDEQ